MKDGTGREAFLATITAALRQVPSLIEEPAPSAVAATEMIPTAVPEELVARMKAELEKVEGQLHCAATGEEAVTLIISLARERGVKRAVLCGGADLLGMGLEEALRAAGITVTGPDLEREALRQAMIEADMGISGVEYAIAETGTLVLVAGRDMPRNATALPPIHVAVMERDRLVSTFEAATALLKQSLLTEDGAWGSSCVTFITGPSRTADIEQTLTIGVHGPGEVHVVVVGV